MRKGSAKSVKISAKFLNAVTKGTVKHILLNLPPFGRDSPLFSQIHRGVIAPSRRCHLTRAL